MPKGSPPTLPSHLSYKSAIVLLPPGSLQPPIEQLRRKHDRNFHRWPPHVNLIYPFLAQPSASQESIKQRVANALKQVKPFSIQCRHADHFLHSKYSATVYLQPSEGSQGGALTKSSSALLQLQSSLQLAFPECDADERTFVPHLSVGQARGEAPAKALLDEVDNVMREHNNESNAAHIEGTESWSLEWTVDRVYILERHGFKGRFKAVDEVHFNSSTT